MGRGEKNEISSKVDKDRRKKEEGAVVWRTNIFSDVNEDN